MSNPWSWNTGRKSVSNVWLFGVLVSNFIISCLWGFLINVSVLVVALVKC